MLNIALAGVGTVGGGVVRLLQKNAELITVHAGKPIVIKAVSALDRAKKRDCNLTGITWVDDARELARIPGVDAVVELIGGAEGTALELALAALKNGKHYITANKALLAAHGAELARLAERNKLQILFEAAVAGGIPIIKTLREGLAANHIISVRGILNGTCNYILTRMQDAQVDFATALREAQQKGYAEADPAADIDGHDSACKLAILAALAFDTAPNLAAVRIKGIRHITAADLQKAAEKGCHIKLVGTARKGPSGIEQHVEPELMPKDGPLGGVNGALNAITIESDYAGETTLQGLGAGAEPTASAVVADIIDLARGVQFKGPLFK